MSRADLPRLNDKLTALLEELGSLEDKDVFFIGGVIKSGTTWVERLMDSHPQVVCKGEAHFGSLLEPLLREAVAAYNSVIPKKGNWSRHRREGTHVVSPSRYSYLSRELDVLYARAIQLMLLKWAGVPGVKCIGEKTPDNIQYFERFKQLFPGARFIYVVRDVRDVAVSGWFFNLILDANDTLAHVRDINEFSVHMARLWVQDVAAGLRFVEENDQHACCVRYEDLWGRPLEETSRLFRFLGVDADDRQVKSSVDLTDFSRLSGGRARGMENRSSFYRKGVVGDWKTHLSSEALSTIEASAGGLMGRLGYV